MPAAEQVSVGSDPDDLATWKTQMSGFITDMKAALAKEPEFEVGGDRLDRAILALVKRLIHSQ
jgi:hypothetical protein